MSALVRLSQFVLINPQISVDEHNQSLFLNHAKSDADDSGVGVLVPSPSGKYLKDLGPFDLVALPSQSPLFPGLEMAYTTYLHFIGKRSDDFT